MPSRRWSSIAATIVVVFLSLLSTTPAGAFTPAHLPASASGSGPGAPVRAQLGGNGLVSVVMTTCSVDVANDTVLLTTTDQTPFDASNCVDGLPAGTSLTIDGVEPDIVTPTTAIWSTVIYGTHTLTAGTISVPLQFNIESESMQFYALYERAPAPGGWAEIRVKDCAIAPVGKTVLVGISDSPPAGYSVCVDGNLDKRDYGMLVNGLQPTYWDTTSGTWKLTDGSYVATAHGGARYDFTIDSWTVVMVLYTKGEVTSLPPDPGNGTPPVDGLPNTGTGTIGGSAPTNRDAVVPVALLIASVVLGYVSFRAVRGSRP